MNVSGPRFYLGKPLPGSGVPIPPPVRPNGVACVGCADLAKSYRAACDRANTAEVTVRTLQAKVADLTDALNRRDPTLRELLELRARLERLANEEQRARQFAIDTEAQLLERALHAERTIANLHRRMNALGITP